MCDPLKPPWGIEGWIVFRLCPFPDESADLTKFGANRCSRLTASPDFCICDPLTPQCLLGYWGATWIYPMSIPRWIRRHYQNWCQSDSFPWLLNCWPPKPPPSDPLCLESQFAWRISIPRWICRYVPNVVTIGPAVWQLPHTFECLTPKPPPPPSAPIVSRGQFVWRISIPMWISI